MEKNIRNKLVYGIVGLLLLNVGCEAPRTTSLAPRKWTATTSLEERVSRAITDTPQTYETNPSISADGKKVVFEAQVNNNKEIFLKDLETGQSMNISNSPANDYQPSISAEGKKVIFLSDRTGNPEIHMVDLAELFYAKGLKSKDIKTAISYFKQAVDIDLLHISSHHQLGTIYDKTRDYDKAVEEFAIVADLYTKDLLKSLTQTMQENFTQQKLGALIRDTIAAYDNLALAYMHSGDNRSAANSPVILNGHLYYMHSGDNRSAANVHYDLGMLFDSIEWNNFAITEFKKGVDIDPSPSEDTYNMLGRLYTETEDYEKAGQTLRKTLVINPNSTPAHINLGLVYLKQGLEKDAKMEFQRALEIEPNSTEVYQNFAVYYYEKQNYQNALNQWQELAKIDPDYPNLKRNIDLAKKKLKEVDQVVGQEYNLSDLPESQAYIDKAKAKITKLPPQVVNVRHILIAAPPNIDDQTRRQRKVKAEEIREQLLKGADFAEMAARYSDCPSKAEGGSLGTFRRGKMVKPFEDAAFSQSVGEIGPVIETVYGYHIVQVMDRLAEADSVLLPEAQETDPRNADDYNRRGVVYGRKGQFDQAIADFNKTIELKPDYADAYYNRGVIYDRRGQYDKAIADFNKAIELKPVFARTYCCRGVVYSNIKEYKLAIADFNKAIELEPNFAEVYYYRGEVYANEGLYEQAIADFDKAIELKPGYVVAYAARGYTYHFKDEYDLAIADLDKAIELKPDFARAYRCRGEVYRKKKQYEKAIANFNKAIELKPDFALAFCSRGITHCDMDEYDRSIADCNKAIELKPNCAEAYSARGNAYGNKGDYDRARQDWNHALAIDPTGKAGRIARQHLQRLHQMGR